MLPIAITDHEFGQFQRFIFEAAGISLAPAKKALVCGRLGRRLQHHALGSYRDYLDLLRSRAGAAEVQTAIDLLTTNETYFFREPRHFDVLRRQAAQRTVRTQPFRVWSAACSSGEEVYSIAMVLDDSLGAAPWDVLGSDISERVLQRAACAASARSRAPCLSHARCASARAFRRSTSTRCCRRAALSMRSFCAT